MAVRLLGTPIEARDYFPFLKWLILTGIVIFALALSWYFGLIQMLVKSDRSYISLVIFALYVATSLHCLWLILVISREINCARRVREQIEAGTEGYSVKGESVRLSNGEELVPCKITNHIRNLILKAGHQGNSRLDQSLLLRSLSDQLKGSQQLGWFVADVLLKLGLLGTVIGFILMLAPIGGINTFDVETMKSALTSMSSGMAVALFTTLAGLISGTLLKVQYYFLDDGTAYLFGITTELTEVHVVSILDRTSNGG